MLKKNYLDKFIKYSLSAVFNNTEYDCRKRGIATDKDQNYGQFVHGDKKKSFILLYENKERNYIKIKTVFFVC